MATSWTQTADDYRIETDDEDILAFLATFESPWDGGKGGSPWVIFEDSPFRLQETPGTGCRMPRETFEAAQREFGLK